MKLQQNATTEISSTTYVVQGIDVSKSILVGIVKECLRYSLKKINALGSRPGQAFGFCVNERASVFYHMSDIVYNQWVSISSYIIHHLYFCLLLYASYYCLRRSHYCSYSCHNFPIQFCCTCKYLLDLFGF